MTVHKATFVKLVQNRHDAEQIADFFQAIAATYLRLSDSLRSEARH